MKISADEGEGYYHCMSRSVNGEWLFDPVAREVLRKQLWQIADFCGVQLLTYTILSNHFHVLVRVPRRTSISDAELLRRFASLYPRPTRFQTARLAVIRQQLAADGPDAITWRRRQCAMMGDISAYLKLVKQRFSIWFNRNHERFGTLWSERFKSVLVEPKRRLLLTLAAYIDLNSVRAGLVSDPVEYRFCGYAEAVAGSAEARRGLMTIAGERNWADTSAGYRQLLFGTADGPRAGGRPSPGALQAVLAAGGRLSLAALLLCRLRYLTDGLALGGRAFVARHCVGGYPASSPQPVPPFADWGDLNTLRALRRQHHSHSRSPTLGPPEWASAPG